MVNALLLLVLVNAQGAELVAVQAFADMVACIAEQDRLAPEAKAKITPGQRYVLSCVPVDSAGVDS